jgi:UDPglucose--hexose-1-phosphate uridylyltransferase
MPEIRENPATKRWVIIATERAKRPEDFKKSVETAIEHPAYDPKCPFCEGNEKPGDEEIFSLRAPGTKPGGKGWHVKVIPNKFPALVPPQAGDSIEVKRHKSGMYLHMEGIGKHEVVVESPIHNKTIATMSIEEVSRIIRAYQERYMVLDWDPAYKLVIIFRNNGGRPELPRSTRIHRSWLLPLFLYICDMPLWKPRGTTRSWAGAYSVIWSKRNWPIRKGLLCRMRNL